MLNICGCFLHPRADVAALRAAVASQHNTAVIMDEPVAPGRKLKHRRAAALNLFVMFGRNCGMGIDLLLFDNPDFEGAEGDRSIPSPALYT